MCDCQAFDALEMAVWNRTRAGQVLNGLVHDWVGTLQYLSIRYSERLAENDIVASVGSRADSYDTCDAEAFNSPDKWELGLDDGPRDCHGVRSMPQQPHARSRPGYGQRPRARTRPACSGAGTTVRILDECQGPGTGTCEQKVNDAMVVPGNRR
jgi:hypothetical protein